MDEKKITYDVDGTEVMTCMINSLLNDFPALSESESVDFSELDSDGGTAFFPSSGPVVTDRSESITGHVHMTCQYPFMVVRRVAAKSERQKISAKEWLDTLGRWLEQQPVMVNRDNYLMEKYPVLTGNRVIKSIERVTPSYQAESSQKDIQDWVINLVLKYESEYDKEWIT